MTRYLIRSILIASVFLTAPVWAGPPLAVDESPASSREWGFHPADGSATRVTPPGFAWRPQKDAARYELQCARDVSFLDVAYSAEDIRFNVHCPPRTLPAGKWFWRFRFYGESGDVSDWSTPRSFTIAEDARELPLPARDDLMARIPRAHPRLFIRPEQAPELRRRAQTDLKDRYDALVTECEKLLADPPPTEEPPRYPEGMKRGSDPWRDIWWGNRRYTQKALDGAATLAFTWLLGGHEAYGQLARRILMDCAKWDPRGSTGYRYNDEAGMPYNYYFSRTYTFVNDLLTEEERDTCRAVMQVRGDEMYRHLYPRHLWRPYASHSNRAWHFLGEIGIAFLDEIPEAADWAWFAANVFACVYPVWNDEDGGWHEGSSYWSSYINRFTWWADIMRAAMGIDAYQKPYFSRIGDYAMYLQPPGTQGGGFGDLTARRRSRHSARLMTVFAAQAQNPYWQWYVDAHDRRRAERQDQGQQGTRAARGRTGRASGAAGGYVGFIRGNLPQVEARSPADLPTSRCFLGVGQAVLNADLLNAENNVEVIFKSSPFGSQSHGYEAQNAFLLYAFGERLFIRTGRRDSYGSRHHKEWMWQTKSVNSITVNGEGQVPHSAAALGEITDFHTSDAFDYVAGEAAQAYDGKLDRFTRRILFVKPEAVIIFDQLAAPQPATYAWHLHAPVEMAVAGQHDIRVVNEGASCRADFLWPPDLQLAQTDRFDPPPRPRVKLVEHHLTAKTPEPAGEQAFVTVLRPYRTGQALEGEARLEKVAGGFSVAVPLADGEVKILLRTAPDGAVAVGGMTTDGEVGAIRFDMGGKIRERFVAGGETVEAR